MKIPNKLEGYGNYYFYPDGSCVSFQGGRLKILKPYKHTQGYEQMTLVDDAGKHKKHLVHRIIAELFVENKRTEARCINHKNGNKKDNSYTNLEWCTPKENNRHSYFVLGNTQSGYRRRPVKKIGNNGKLVKVYNSIREAAEDNEVSPSLVHSYCNGRRKQNKDYQLYYHDVAE